MMIRTIKESKQYIESLKGNYKDKLVKLFKDIKNKKISKDKLEVKYEFDLENPHKNTESKVSKILSAWYPGITKEDVIEALKEIKVSSFEDLIFIFNK